MIETTKKTYFYKYKTVVFIYFNLYFSLKHIHATAFM
jgi:hypothetical protein